MMSVHYKFWMFIWIGWNLLLCCIYTELGILKQAYHLLNFNLGNQIYGGRSWWSSKHILCTLSSLIKSNIKSKLSECTFNGHLVDLIHICIQLLLGVIGLIIAFYYGFFPLTKLGHAQSWNYYYNSRKKLTTNQPSEIATIANSTLSTIVKRDRNGKTAGKHIINNNHQNTPTPSLNKRKSPFADLYNNLADFGPMKNIDFDVVLINETENIDRNINQNKRRPIMTTNLDENSFSDLFDHSCKNYIKNKKRDDINVAMKSEFMMNERMQRRFCDSSLCYRGERYKNDMNGISPGSISTDTTGYPLNSLNNGNSDAGTFSDLNDFNNSNIGHKNNFQRAQYVKNDTNTMGHNLIGNDIILNRDDSETTRHGTNYDNDNNDNNVKSDNVFSKNSLSQISYISEQYKGNENIRISDKLMQRQLSLARRRRANRNSNKRKKSNKAKYLAIETHNKVNFSKINPINCDNNIANNDYKTGNVFNNGYIYMSKEPQPIQNNLVQPKTTASSNTRSMLNGYNYDQNIINNGLINYKSINTFDSTSILNNLKNNIFNPTDRRRQNIVHLKNLNYLQ
ncbi:probable serine/threonine-protein kinase clkA isoform X2 [Gordionus sp. m RMFG-2023]|uniref:probable serine/threonine-protein kinase clkA isoform X2 n=1 Tax=Gordionus sp. m RMFG-2023 TaxID=3053472 RepID=UPI0031FBB606